jgi:hypothetical protein
VGGKQNGHERHVAADHEATDGTGTDPEMNIFDIVIDTEEMLMQTSQCGKLLLFNRDKYLRMYGVIVLVLVCRHTSALRSYFPYEILPSLSVLSTEAVSAQISISVAKTILLDQATTKNS